MTSNALGAVLSARPSGPGGGWGDYLRDPAGTLARLAATAARFLLAWAPILGPTVVVLAVCAVTGRRWWTARTRRRLAQDARQILVLPAPIVDPAGGEALWANLVGLLRPGWRRAWAGQPHLGFEYGFSETGVQIQIWVPGVVPPGLVERAVAAAWPGAHTRTTPATPPLPDTTGSRRRVVVGGRLRLARGEGLPIRTEFDADPVRALLGAPLGLAGGEHACVQILARPVAGRRVTRARRAARRHATGHALRPAGRILDLLTGLITGQLTARPTARGSAASRTGPQAALEEAAVNRAVVVKQRGAQYATTITYAVTTTLPATAHPNTVAAAVDTARGRAHALAGAFAAYNGHNRYRRYRVRHPTHALTHRRLGRGDLLSVPELAALAHLPLDAHLPGLARAGARALAPPPGIAAPGPGVKPLGVTDTGPDRPVGLRVPDARHHLHVIGATGSGKSTLLGRLILDDIDAGRGVVLIDPKGDLVTDLLARLPTAAADRVVLLDAGSRTRPPCLNPLDPGDTPPHAGTDGAGDLAVDNLVSVFRRLYAAWWGPRTDDVMRAACLTLRAGPAIPTLADLPKLLTDPAYRARATDPVTDPVLRGFWTWYEALSEPARAQVIAPLLNKLRAFLLRPFARDALAGGPADLDLADVLDHGGICLVRIPKGTLGEETCRLVGSLVVARAWQATTARASLPQPQRRDASLVVDECHNFLNLPYPIEDMLAEARGFRLAMTLAHQHLAQLPRELREGLSTNARSKIFFTASPEDARDLARHTAPQLTEHDLAHLDAYHAAARLVLHGAQAPAFTLHTEPLPPPVPGRARAVRAAAARRRPTGPRSAMSVLAPPTPPGQAPSGPPAATAPADRATRPSGPGTGADPRRRTP
jgi:hypothetical protein